MVRIVCYTVILLGSHLVVQGQSAALPASEDSLKATIRYGDKGFEFRTADSNYLMQIEWRLQWDVSF